VFRLNFESITKVRQEETVQSIFLQDKSMHALLLTVYGESNSVCVCVRVCACVQEAVKRSVQESLLIWMALVWVCV